MLKTHAVFVGALFCLVQQASSAEPPTQVTATPDLFCSASGGTVTLEAVGGSGDVLEWYVGGCGPGFGAVLVGIGTPLVLSQPRMDATYRARWVDGGGASACVSVDVTVIGGTQRVSVNSAGLQANHNSSFQSAISADGRFVAFDCRASNLVSGDTNELYDVFVHDRETGQTTRVSVDSAGGQGNGGSFYPAISADGRFVAFQSTARNLVPGDMRFWRDLFVHDRQSGETTRVSVNSAGEQVNGDIQDHAISADGRFVAFSTTASNLVPDDTNFLFDVFVHDRQTGETARVSVDSSGAQANSNSAEPVISADGRCVAFYSGSDNLVSGDTNISWDAFVHDRQSGETTRVSVNSDGVQGNGDSYATSISADARYVAFYSGASNLVSGDTNGRLDAFVHDRQTGQTTRVSISSAGGQGYDETYSPSISANGRYVAFYSDAWTLVPGDTNGRRDVFVHDRQSAHTTRISVDSAGGQANNASAVAVLSGDGRYVAFHSAASNLVAGDTNGFSDIFIHDRQSAYFELFDQPDDRRTCMGRGAAFTIGPPMDNGTLSFRWRRDGLALVNGGAISGADTTTLTIDPVSATDEAAYDCVVTSACSTVTSDPATLNVQMGLAGDANCDSFVTVADIGGFVLALTDSAGYATTYPSCDAYNADVNCDGFVTVADIGGFVQLLTH